VGRVAIIQFPGSNCEVETGRALSLAGLESVIFRWNENASKLVHFGAFILPGGFSYQDRIRAGVVAAKDSILERIVTESDKGKPVLGICNGAQILVESGLVPGGGRIRFALAPNIMPVSRSYLCRWVYIRPASTSSLFTRGYRDDEIIPMPIAHAEGRFVSNEDEYLDNFKQMGSIAFRYCDGNGSINEEFPINPNGSILSIAGLSNQEGNVLALMPHPERACCLRHIPPDIDSSWRGKRLRSVGDFAALEEPGPGLGIFKSIAQAL